MKNEILTMDELMRGIKQDDSDMFIKPRAFKYSLLEKGVNIIFNFIDEKRKNKRRRK